VPEDQPIIEGLPSILDHLDEGCRTHFASVRAFLDDRQITYEVRPRLVRGLDYYTRTTFEVVHGSLGAQNSVLGGGRYDGLAEALGSKVHSPGIGFSIGEDRLVMSVEEAHPGLNKESVDVFIAPMGESALRHCTMLARELRRNGVKVEIAFEGKLKRAMELANKLNARHALIVGDNEISSGVYALKDMTSGGQENVTREQLAERLYGGKH
jgi:histidyl-tRNA synthetase